MKTKNIAIIIVVVLILLIGVGVWFWLGSKKEVEEGVVPPGEEEEEETTESLTDILGKVKGITSFKYDMVVAVPGQATTTQKIWFEGKKMRMEATLEGQKAVYLVDISKQQAYLYTPAQNMAMKIDFGQVQESAGESPEEQTGYIMNYNPTTVGSEVLDGKSCLVIEYTTGAGEVKMWLWKKYGFPIKTETTTAKGTTVVELKNIELVDIPDSMFELPAGVQVMEMPSGF